MRLADQGMAMSLTRTLARLGGSTRRADCAATVASKLANLDETHPDSPGGRTLPVVNHSIRNVTRMRLLALVAVAFAVGCARAPGVPGPAGNVRSPILPEASELDDTADYDPWQPFNEVMFSFNHDVLDRFLVKPVATAWDTVIPRPARRAFARAIDNLDMPRRLVNNVLQFRPLGAGREVGRFLVNSTVGVAGLFDVASSIDLEKSDADTGQTLALYGLGPGPYLVLPTMAPSTLRDVVGTTADGMLDPLGFFLPFIANEVKSIVTAINERSLQLQMFANVEESVLDLYSAARNGYLQRRRTVVARAVAEREAQMQWAFGPPEPAEAPLAVAAAEPEAVR
jgi:phospholipid-binding lipoprotein MlaA